MSVWTEYHAWSCKICFSSKHAHICLAIITSNDSCVQTKIPNYKIDFYYFFTPLLLNLLSDSYSYEPNNFYSLTSGTSHLPFTIRCVCGGGGGSTILSQSSNFFMTLPPLPSPPARSLIRYFFEPPPSPKLFTKINGPFIFCCTFFSFYLCLFRDLMLNALSSS